MQHAGSRKGISGDRPENGALIGVLTQKALLKGLT